MVLTKLALRDALSNGFRTEFFIKTGLVLLGASINLKVLVTAAGPAIIQALLLITIVFGFTWWLGGRLGLEDKLRALLASAVSICGVSAAGAVRAKREQLAYARRWSSPSRCRRSSCCPGYPTSSACRIRSPARGSVAAGAIAGEDALQIATIVKTTQNALIGVVAIALTAYFALKVERKDAARPTIGQFWERFPKFVLGFIAASIIGTLYLQLPGGKTGNTVIATVNDLRTWFLIFAFVSIGLEFSLKGLREAGWRPIAVFASATRGQHRRRARPCHRVVRHFHPQLAVTLGPCRQPGRGEVFSR